MAFLPRVGAIGLGLHRVSIRFIHPTKSSAFSLVPRVSARFASTSPENDIDNNNNHQQMDLEKYKEKCCVEPAHFKAASAPQDTKTDNYVLAHSIWSAEEANEVEITHQKPSAVCDWTAYLIVQTMRKSFDLFSGYTIKSWMKTLDERDMLSRCIFLETVAGVPGFAAAMVRHLQSLRRMERDNGWIHTLLEEAENERMHLMTFLQLRKPGPFFRGSVAVTQIIFTGLFSLSYLISPHFCHRFVGYLEEQAVITYTDILKSIDAGQLPMWSALSAPEIAVKYWRLPAPATMRDVILVIRADEAHHRLVNHTLGSMDLKKKNPFKPGE